jgi:hypothetical protein
MIGLFLVAEVVVVVLSGFRVLRVQVPRGMTYYRDQGRSVSPDQTAAPTAWCGHRMLTREAPPCAILLHGQFMAGSKVPSEHLPVPAAFQANDIIAVNRSPDRHGRSSLPAVFGDRFT